MVWIVVKIDVYLMKIKSRFLWGTQMSVFKACSWCSKSKVVGSFAIANEQEKRANNKKWN